MRHSFSIRLGEICRRTSPARVPIASDPSHGVGGTKLGKLSGAQLNRRTHFVGYRRMIPTNDNPTKKLRRIGTHGGTAFGRTKKQDKPVFQVDYLLF